jgi:hypothetical protein
MARGGKRQGQAGRSYSNRRDLNVDRAPQPGSVPASEQVAAEAASTGFPAVGPDDVPNLTDPTTTDVSLPESLMQASVPNPSMSPSQMVLFAALKADPGNPALRRIRNTMQANGGAL